MACSACRSRATSRAARWGAGLGGLGGVGEGLGGRVRGVAGVLGGCVRLRGLAALAQWVQREGANRSVPRGHSEEIAVDGETEPVVVKLGVWVSNTRSRRDRLAPEQLNALAALGHAWAAQPGRE